MNVGYYESKRKWWSRLTSDHPNGLLKHQTPPLDSLTICLHSPNPEDPSKPILTFSVFSPLYVFANEMLKTNPLERRFFEVILGNRAQKPYFDIDINDSSITEREGLELIDCLKKSILADERVAESDILVFSSHGKTKLSYHVIIDNWCLPDYNSNKTYCNRIISRIPDSYHMKRFMDPTMYKSIQQLRIFGCTKVLKSENDSPRFKILDKCELDCYDKDYRFKFIGTLMSSLITNTSSCRILEYTAPVQKVWVGDNEDLSVEEIKIVENLPFILDGTFEILDVKGRLVPLKRKAPSFCILCQRTHENENPYLTISNDSTKIYIHCRRSVNDKFEIWRRIENDPEPKIDIKMESNPSVKSKLILEKLLGKK